MAGLTVFCGRFCVCVRKFTINSKEKPDFLTVFPHETNFAVVPVENAPFYREKCV